MNYILYFLKVLITIMILLSVSPCLGQNDCFADRLTCLSKMAPLEFYETVNGLNTNKGRLDKRERISHKLDSSVFTFTTMENCFR